MPLAHRRQDYPASYRQSPLQMSKARTSAASISCTALVSQLFCRRGAVLAQILPQRPLEILYTLRV